MGHVRIKAVPRASSYHVSFRTEAVTSDSEAEKPASLPFTVPIEVSFRAKSHRDGVEKSPHLPSFLYHLDRSAAK